MNRREFLRLGAQSLLCLPLMGYDFDPDPTAEIIAALSDPAFYTTTDSGRRQPILVGQFDENQYPGYKADQISYLVRNSCGEAIIATIVRAYSYLLENKRPTFTISDVTKLSKSTGQMTDLDMNRSLKSIGAETGYFRVINNLEPFWHPSQIIASHWDGILDTANREVFPRGGLLILRVLKYSTPGNLKAHFIILTSNDLILDPIGPWDNRKAGRIVKSPLADYCEKFEGETGLLSVQGVVPITRPPSIFNRS